MHSIYIIHLYYVWSAEKTSGAAKRINLKGCIGNLLRPVPVGLVLIGFTWYLLDASGHFHISASPETPSPSGLVQIDSSGGHPPLPQSHTHCSEVFGGDTASRVLERQQREKGKYDEATGLGNPLIQILNKDGRLQYFGPLFDPRANHVLPGWRVCAEE